MSSELDRPTGPCAPVCSHCRMDASCPAEPGALSGWRLTATAAGVFLLPLGLAAAGAALCGQQPTWQFLGALAGLVVGLVGAVVVARCVRRAGKEAG